ncbi:bifunctional metallophosphatase/5'-nucleotidase [Paraburkholderia aromaticivorans]|uniref:bifunctional metallophosphatase/5'-nucleotidase n=1 Tax=Paraburkholderia aromaticivorans TaxID=2026199 RepID=UPI0038BB88BE
MKIPISDRQATATEVPEGKEVSSCVSSEAHTRRQFLAGSVAVGASMLLHGNVALAGHGTKTFTILHTNDMHSAFIGMGPSSDYTPFKLNADKTRGGFARLAAMIAKRRKEREKVGPVLVLDAGDYSMGTAFGAATREIGGELRLMSRMGYDATTFGNHEFDLGPDGLGKSIGVASKAGPIPAVLASNTDLSANDASLTDLQRLSKDGLIRRYLVIERGGIRFGIFGVLGKEAVIYTTGGAVSFSNANEAAVEMVKVLRESEKVEVVICLSHGGVEKGKDGQYSGGDDVLVAEQAPGIDVVIGGHSHTALRQPIIVNERTPVVQTGKEGENLGELVLTIDGGKLAVESYRLYAIDDTIAGDRGTEDEINGFGKVVTKAVFASRGYSVNEPLAKVPQDLPNTFTDIAASTLLANLVTDAFRNATRADIGFTANGLMRAGLKRGKSGVQTVYDVFSVAPLGAGVIDPTAGSALVTAWFTGAELKNLLEFLLVDNPTHPGEYFPRSSGMRFRYDHSRPAFDVVTAVEMGDLERGYRAIDISGKNQGLYSLSCPLYLGLIIAAIPKFTKGKLALEPKKQDGQPLKSKVEALNDVRGDTPYLLPPPGTLDTSEVATGAGTNGVREIKEWQAIMDHLRSLPVERKGELPTIPVDARASEIRAIKAG